METLVSQKMFRMPPVIANLAIVNQTQPTTQATSQIPYTEIMLCEYYHLVNSLTKITETQLKSIQIELVKTLNNLTKWLDKTGTVNAVELFSAMRHLKQKVNKLGSTKA